MNFPIEDFFSKCDQTRRKLRIWSHLMKKSLMENFLFLRSDNPQASFMNHVCFSIICVAMTRLSWCAVTEMWGEKHINNVCLWKLTKVVTGASVNIFLCSSNKSDMWLLKFEFTSIFTPSFSQSLLLIVKL